MSASPGSDDVQGGVNGHPPPSRFSRFERRRWGTERAERTVLAIARTYTSATRLLEALPVFQGDRRIEVLFTVDDTTPNSAGAAELLHAAGVATVLPWSRRTRIEADLALTASENVDPGGLEMPMVVLPHGVGFQRLVPDSGGPGTRLSGVVPPHRLLGKQVWLTTPHELHRARLAAEHPEVARRCVVVGDLAYDRMRAAAHRRDHFRGALGVPTGTRLVVISTTWGEGSLYATWPTLPADLLAALPADEYRVAFVAHPNLWFQHDPYMVGLWQADAYESGLIRIAPDGGWQAALIAADLVIGDQGTVSVMGAVLDRPFLLAAGGVPVLPGTTAAELVALADRLTPGAPLEPQVTGAIDGHRTDRTRAFAERAFQRTGQAADDLRRFLYERLKLDPPSWPARLAPVAVPRVEADVPLTHVAHAEVADDGAIRIRRFPVRVAGPPAGANVKSLRHLVADDDEPDRRLVDNASVVVRGRPATDDEARDWLRTAPSRHAEAQVVAVAVADGLLVRLGDGTRVRVTGQIEPALSASAAYILRRTGHSLTGQVTVRTGAIERTISLDLASDRT